MVQKSNFVESTSLTDGSYLDFWVNGQNFKISKDNFLAALGALGTIKQVGPVSSVPVLDLTGSPDFGIRNLSALAGQSISIGAQNDIEISPNLVAGSNVAIVPDVNGALEISSYTPLPDIGSELVVTSSSFADQVPSALDVPIQIDYGPGASSAEATIDASGNCTFHIGGTYRIALSITYGRATASGTAVLLVRGLVNGVQVVPTIADSFDSANDRFSAQFSNFATFSPGDVLTAELVRDSSGSNDGGLYAIAPTLGSWSDVASATLSISKLVTV